MATDFDIEKLLRPKGRLPWSICMIGSEHDRHQGEDVSPSTQIEGRVDITRATDEQIPVAVVPKDVLRLFRRIVIFVIGSSVVLAGVIMIVTPGPAIVVIPLGLSILATEFYWARQLRQRLLKKWSKSDPS